MRRHGRHRRPAPAHAKREGKEWGGGTGAAARRLPSRRHTWSPCSRSGAPPRRRQACRSFIHLAAALALRLCSRALSTAERHPGCQFNRRWQRSSQSKPQRPPACVCVGWGVVEGGTAIGRHVSKARSMHGSSEPRPAGGGCKLAAKCTQAAAHRQGQRKANNSPAQPPLRSHHPCPAAPPAWRCTPESGQ